MRSCFRFTRALRAHVSRLSILVLLLASTAMDNIDGNISPSIIVNDSVNTSIVGSYTVTYNVQDRAGNTAAQISRNVNVTAKTGGGGGGAVSYWLLAFLLAVNFAGVIHMRRRAATIKSREDKE